MPIPPKPIRRKSLQYFLKNLLACPSLIFSILIFRDILLCPCFSFLIFQSFVLQYKIESESMSGICYKNILTV